MNVHYFGFLLLLLFSQTVCAQKPLNPPQDTQPKSQIQLIRADSLVGYSGINIQRTFFGNVHFRHRGVDLFCDRAVHLVGSNSLEAYGRIKINQGDTLQIFGDTLFYNGNTRFARIYGKKVLLKDKETTLQTTKLEYNLNEDLAYYPVRGKVNKDSSLLESNTGYYNTKTKYFRYFGDVILEQKNSVLKTDSLEFDSAINQAYFNSKTSISSPDGTLISQKGTYNTASKVAQFYGRSTVENVDYTLTADTLDFNQETGEGVGIGHVLFKSKKDSLELSGHLGIRKKELGYTKMIGETLTRKMEGKDTLLLRADSVLAYGLRSFILVDSLPSIEEDTGQVEFLIASGNVKIFREDFQAICDSLNYDLVDQKIDFFRNPIIWNKDSQLSADSIQAILIDNRINKLELSQKGFVISKDTAENFNQIKGREIVANFDSTTSIDQVFVFGNGESIYFTLDEFNKLVGLNKVLCSTMRIGFKERKVHAIQFKGQPEGKLIPPFEVGKEQIELDGFNWQIEKKPKKIDLLGKEFALKYLTQ